MKKTIIGILIGIVLVVALGAGIGVRLTVYSMESAYSGKMVWSDADLIAADNVYAIWYNPITNKAWDENDTETMVSNDTLTHANAAVGCKDERAKPSDGWFIDTPSQMPDGKYLVKTYNNAVPAVGDTIILGRFVNVMDGFAQSVNDR